MATAFKDYYQALGVSRTATPKEIKTAFRKLARKHHPDLNPNDPGAVNRFKEVNEAHEVLGDPEKRRKYDQFGADWEHGPQMRRPFPGAGGPVEYRTMSANDLEGMFGNSQPFSDFFYSMFGGAGAQSSTGGRTRATPARRGSDVEGEVTISLEDAARGAATTVQVDGSSGSRRVEVSIPAGIRDGARVRAAGQGATGSGGGASGDLFIRVRVSPHQVFTRDGDDLRVKLAVPLDVALLGGSVEVPTVLGKRVSLTIPPETQNGAVLRLKGLGMPALGGKRSGDLHAQVDVRLPLPLNDAQREVAKGLRQAAEKAAPGQV